MLFDSLPEASRPLVKDVWAKLPPDVRRETELTLGAFSKLLRQNPGSFEDLLRMAQRTAGPVVASSHQKVAIVGPVNVGKSTLYNALVKREQDRARSSPVPGTTRHNQTADIGLFQLVDTPGADHGASVGEDEKRIAFDAAEAADFLLIVFDAAGSVTASDRALYQELLALGKPHLVALNKIDEIKMADRRLVRQAAARTLNISPEAVLPVSALNQEGIHELLLEITAAEPRLLAQIGTQLPELRRSLCWQAIRRAAVGSAMVALTPIPFTDLIPLALIQGSLVLTLARIYGQQMNFRRSLELISTLGAGWLARTLFQEVSKIGGLPGWVISASIATSATIAIGFTSMRWFETGTKPSKEEVANYARDAQKKVSGLLSKFVKKPSKKGLTQELEAQLPTILPDDADVSSNSVSQET